MADALPHVKAGIAAGLIRRDDPFVLAHAILGVTDHLARVLVLEQGHGAAEASAATVSFCLEGILSPATAERRLGRAAWLTRSTSPTRPLSPTPRAQQRLDGAGPMREAPGTGPASASAAW